MSMLQSQSFYRRQRLLGTLELEVVRCHRLILEASVLHLSRLDPGKLSRLSKRQSHSQPQIFGLTGPWTSGQMSWEPLEPDPWSRLAGLTIKPTSFISLQSLRLSCGLTGLLFLGKMSVVLPRLMLWSGSRILEDSGHQPATALREHPTIIPKSRMSKSELWLDPSTPSEGGQDLTPSLLVHRLGLILRLIYFGTFMGQATLLIIYCTHCSHFKAELWYMTVVELRSNV